MAMLYNAGKEVVELLLRTGAAVDARDYVRYSSLRVGVFAVLFGEIGTQSF